MKIVITLPLAARLGGAENVLWTLLRRIDRNRIDPLVVFFGPGPFEREVAGLGVRTAVLPSGRLRQAHRGVAMVWRLASLLEEEKPDLVLNWMAKSQLYGATAAKLAGLSDRVVWWQHGLPGGWMDRLATRLPTRVVIACSHESAKLQARLRPRRRTLVVHAGIDDPRRASSGEVEAMRTRLAIPPDRFVIGTVGRLQPGKGQHHVLRAVAELRQRGHNVHGLVIGGTAHGFSPEYEPQLRELSTRLGLNADVAFTGQVADSIPYIQLMDVSINASDREGFGVALLEAMALEVPVIAVDEAGPSEIVEHERSGLLVPRAEPDEFVAAVERLLHDSLLRSKLASGGLTRFRECFTAEGMVRRVEEVLAEVAVS